MNSKEEALALADYLDNNVEAMLFTEQPHLDRASAMIRRLVEELKAKNNYLAQHCEMIDQQAARIVELEKCIPSGLSDPKSYYQGYEDGIQSLTVTDPRPVAFMKDFGGFTDDHVLAIQDGFNIPVYVTKADYQKIKQKKPCDAPQTKPLSDEEIDNLIIDKGHLDCVLDFHPTFDTVSVMRFELRRLARAIEKEHGIK